MCVYVCVCVCVCVEMAYCSSAVKALIFLIFSLHVSSAVKHSMQYVYTAVTQGLHFPEFTIVGQVDGEQFMYYDSNIRKMIPKSEWILNHEGEDFWNQQTKTGQVTQEMFKINVLILKHLFNQTGGFDTLQWLVGCEVDDDGTVKAYNQFGYDGEDLISFDVDTLTWIASKPQTQFIKFVWDAETYQNEKEENYLKNKCPEWLQKYVGYGNRTLERKVPPEMFLFHKESTSPVVLVCHATGFFPKTLLISWQKDGMDVLEDVDLRETLPNPDGSFQRRSILKIPAEELQRHTYTCRIQHSSWEKDHVLQYEPKGRGWICIVVFLLVAFFLLVAGIVVVAWRKVSRSQSRL